jgi:NADPH2:quinone reductase
MTTTIRFHEYGGPAVLKVEDDQVGAPGPAQVRLRQEAIGVNFIDTAFRDGSFAMKLPGVTGVEAAGVVEAIGPGVNGIEPGDRMAYFLSPGSYAAVRTVNAADLIRTPPDLSSAEVATILTKGLTAWAGLNGFYHLKAGEKVLVQGASSNVGQLVSRWAKSMGAVVIGTGSAGKRDLVAPLVNHFVASDQGDIGAEVRKIAPGGVDVVYEFVGKATFSASVAAVRDGGTIVTIGAASGAPVVDKAQLASRNIRVVGGPMAQHVMGSVAEATGAVFDAYRNGVFGEYRATAYPLEKAAAAHEDIAARRKTGPMILVP